MSEYLQEIIAVNQQNPGLQEIEETPVLEAPGDIHELDDIPENDLEEEPMQTCDQCGHEYPEDRERVEIGKDENGKQLYCWATGKTVKEFHDSIVRIYIENNLVEGLTGQNKQAPSVHGSNRVRFKPYVSKWLLTYKKKSVRETTFNSYNSMLNVHMYPAFGKMNMDDIKTGDIQDFLNNRDHLAEKTLKEMMDFLSMIFEDALEDGVVQKNPVKSRKLKNPSDKKTVRVALTMENFIEILNGLSSLDTTERRLMALLMFTGIRRGEALGLRWEDFNFDDWSVHVQRNVTYAKNQPHVGDLKTDNGDRHIPVLKILWRLLDHTDETGYIIGGDHPITLTKYRRIFNAIKKKIFLHGATAHIFRHTFLTFLSNAGVAPKIIQVIAGHADISTTMNVYTDGQMVEILNAGKTLDQYFPIEGVA